MHRADQPMFSSRRCLFENRWHILAFSFFVSALLLRLYHIDYRSIWMDEDRQAEIAGQGFNLGMVKRAAKQHQPPIDYYFEAIGLTLFGWTEVGVRIHAAFWGSLGVLLFLLLLKKNQSPPVAVIVPTVLLMFDAFHVRYSQEGRPIAAGVFFSVLYVYSVFNFIRSNRRGRGMARDVVFHFLSTLALILSVGFQPFAFICASNIALAPGLSYSLYRRRVAAVWGTSLGSVLLTFPVLSMAIARGKAYIGERDFFERLFAITEGFNHLSLATWTDKFDSIFTHYQIVAAILLLPGICGMVRLMSDDTSRKWRFFASYVLLFVLVFPPIFDALFYSQINYKIKPRYFAMLLPPLFATLGILLHGTWISLTYYTSEKQKWAPVLLTLLLLTLVPAVYWSTSSLLDKYVTHDKTGWRQFYHLLLTEGKKGDVAYLMNLRAHGKWTPHYHATRFYYPARSRRPVALRDTKQLIADYKRRRFKDRQQAFIVTPYGHENIKEVDLLGAEGVRFYKFPKMSVIQIASAGKNIKETFRTIVKNIPKTPDSFRAFVILTSMLTRDGEVEEAAIVMEQLAKLDRTENPPTKAMGRRIGDPIENEGAD